MSFSRDEQKLVEFASGQFENLPHIKFALKALAEKLKAEVERAEAAAKPVAEAALEGGEKAAEAAVEVALAQTGAGQE